MSSSTSPKGKEKATTVGSGSDSDDNFFVYKRPKPSKPVKLIPKLPPSTVRARSSSPEYESTDSDNPTAKKRRKRKRAKPKRDPTPEWLEITVAAKERANSRSVTREGSSAQAQTIEINDSDAEAEVLKRKTQRRVIAITPPPALSEEQRAKVFSVVADFVKQIPEDNDDQTDTPARPARAATPEGFEPDEQVNVIISMVADPERRLLGHSEKAIQRYEKTRTLLINRRDPFSRMMRDWADLQSKEPGDLVIEYNGARLGKHMSPLRLGIPPKAEVRLLSYEVAVYDKIVKEREEERERRMAGEGGDDKDDEAKDESKVEEEPVEEEKKGTILRLRGSWGEANIKVQDHIQVKQLAVYYCRKVLKVGRETELVLSFDGERLEEDAIVGDLGVEDRDMIDVKCPPA